jgi:hypothetical protein
MDPAMPVVYMTGGHGRQWLSKGVPQSVLLQKPFVPTQILTAVAKLLNIARGSAAADNQIPAPCLVLQSA